MFKTPSDLSIDELLAQATCCVVVNGVIRGTAWLVSRQGHLLTAGHILGINQPISKVHVQFPEDIPYEAYRVQWGYQQDLGIDFAVLKLSHPLTSRLPLPISSKREVAGKFVLRGYGTTFKDQSVGKGNFLGFFDPQNSPGNRLFQLRSPELGEGGYSGAAVFSLKLQAVVAMQIEATQADIGAGRDTVLAMPLYRIAQKWEKLFALEKGVTSQFKQADIFNVRSSLKSIPLEPLFFHPQPPEMYWHNRIEEINILNNLWEDKQTKVVALVGLGGVGKSSLSRRWYDQIHKNKRQPDGFFWWSFYYQKSFDEFLETVLLYLGGEHLKHSKVLSPWVKTQQLLTFLGSGKFIIVLDGLEVMQEIEDSGDSSNLGCLLDKNFSNFLQLCADPKIHSSFIVITSRLNVKELQTLDGSFYKQLKINCFPEIDGVNYLKNRQLKGSDKALRKLSSDYGHHALSLSLLAGYLNEYFDGNLQQAHEIPFLATYKGTKVNSILQAYESRLTDTQKAFMKLISAIRRPITHGMLEGMLGKDKFTRNSPLIKLLSSYESFELRGMISHLEKRGLISREKNSSGEQCYTTHSIIRGFFYEKLAADYNLMLTLHLCLRNYALSIGVPDSPTCLEDLMPLFDAIYYSCQVKYFEEAVQIYRENMPGKFGNWGISLRFGAYNFQLSLLRYFFDDGDFLKSSRLINFKSVVFILFEVGWCFDKLGKTSKAELCYTRAANISVNSSDSITAIPAFYYLASFQEKLGKLDKAEISLNKAINFCKASQNKYWECNALAYMGWVQFLKGNCEQADCAYKEALALVKFMNFTEKQLIIFDREYSEENLFFILGVQYAMFLLCVYRDIPKSFYNTKLNLRVCKQLGWIEGIAYCHRFIGDIELVKENYDKARNNYIKALRICREFDIKVESWRILLGLSKVAVARKSIEQATAYLNSAIHMVDKSQYLIGSVDIRNYKAELDIDLCELNSAKLLSKQALEIAEKSKYAWGKASALHSLGKIAYLLNDLDRARHLLAQSYAIKRYIRDPSTSVTEKLLNRIKDQIN